MTAAVNAYPDYFRLMVATLTTEVSQSGACVLTAQHMVPVVAGTTLLASVMVQQWRNRWVVGDSKQHESVADREPMAQTPTPKN